MTFAVGGEVRVRDGFDGVAQVVEALGVADEVDGDGHFGPGALVSARCRRREVCVSLETPDERPDVMTLRSGMYTLVVQSLEVGELGATSSYY